MPEMLPEQWKDLEKHFKEGESLHSLEKRYPISRPAIRKHLRKCGYDTSKRKSPPRPTREGSYSLAPTENQTECQVPKDILVELIREKIDYGRYELAEKLLEYLVPCPEKGELRRELEAGKEHGLRAEV